MTSSKKTALAAIAAAVAIIAGIAFSNCKPPGSNNVETNSHNKEQVFDAERDPDDSIKEAEKGRECA